MRFTPHEETDFDAYVDFVTRLSCQCLIVKHDADEDVARPHCHLVINYNKTLSTFRQQFKKKFPNYEGNKDYQLKDCSDDGEKPLWYICKMDQPEVLYKMNYTEKDIERFHQESENYVNALKKQKQNENVKPPKEYKEKVKTLTFPQIVAKEMQRKYLNIVWDFGFREHRRYVFETTCDMLGQYGKTLDDLIIHRLMNGVMMILEPDSCKMLFRKKCVFDKYDQDACKD